MSEYWNCRYANPMGLLTFCIYNAVCSDRFLAEIINPKNAGNVHILRQKEVESLKETYECCIDCEKRKIGCHAQCKEYNELKKYFDEEKKKIRADLDSSDFAEIYRKHSEKKLKRRKWDNKI